MKINQTQYQSKYYNKSSNPSFGQVRPKHLYIDCFGFKKNKSWAKGSIKIIEEATKKMNIGLDFKRTLNFIAEQYGIVNKNTVFGRLRNTQWSTGIYNKYQAYHDRVISFAQANAEVSLFYNYSPPPRIYTTTIKSEISKKLLYLNEIWIYKTKNEGTAGHFVELVAPDEKVIPAVIEEIIPIYKNILKNKEKLSSENIKIITKKYSKNPLATFSSKTILQRQCRNRRYRGKITV